MGVSTDAILIYGIDFGGEDEAEYPLFQENEDGELNVETAIPWQTNDHLLIHVRHCSGEYPMHIIGLRSTYYDAGRGNPIRFDQLPGMGWISKVHYETLKLFCQEHDLPYSEPKWILCSMWW